jgi:hypothetical protein
MGRGTTSWGMPTRVRKALTRLGRGPTPCDEAQAHPGEELRPLVVPHTTNGHVHVSMHRIRRYHPSKVGQPLAEDLVSCDQLGGCTFGDGHIDHVIDGMAVVTAGQFPGSI